MRWRRADKYTVKIGLSAWYGIGTKKLLNRSDGRVVGDEELLKRDFASPGDFWSLMPKQGSSGSGQEDLAKQGDLVQGPWLFFWGFKTAKHEGLPIPQLFDKAQDGRPVFWMAS